MLLSVFIRVPSTSKTAQHNLQWVPTEKSDALLFVCLVMKVRKWPFALQTYPCAFLTGHKYLCCLAVFQALEQNIVHTSALR